MKGLVPSMVRCRRLSEPWASLNNTHGSEAHSHSMNNYMALPIQVLHGHKEGGDCPLPLHLNKLSLKYDKMAHAQICMTQVRDGPPLEAAYRQRPRQILTLTINRLIVYHLS